MRERKKSKTGVLNGIWKQETQLKTEKEKFNFKIEINQKNSKKEIPKKHFIPFCLP